MVLFPPQHQQARHPFGVLVLSFAAGIWGQRWAGIPPGALIVAGGVLFLAAFRFRKYDVFFLLILLLFATMGMLRYAHWHKAHLQLPYLTHLPLQIDELVVTLRSVQAGKRWRAIGSLEEMRRNGSAIPMTGGALIYFPYRFTGDPAPGQRLLCKNVQLEPLPAPRNPGQFDYGAYLRDRGIAAQVHLRDAAQIRPASPARVFSPESVIFYPARKFLSHKLDAHFTPAAAGVLKALLLGVREDLPRDIREDFQNAGVMHVLAISGLHVGFVGWIIYWLLSFLPVYFKTRNWLTMGFLFAYMFLTGSNPPVVRATLMAALFFTALNLERRGALWNYLFAAAFLILLIQPQQLFWVGFQFSFAAVMAIVYFYPHLSGWFRPLFDRIDREETKVRLNRWVVAPFGVTLAAQIGTVPLGMYYFHKFSLISFFLNLIIIPFTGVIVMAGFAFLGLSLFSDLLAGWFAAGGEILLCGMTRLVQGAAGLPGAFFNITAFAWADIGVYLAVVLLVFRWNHPPARRWLTAASLALLMISGSRHLAVPPAFDLVLLDVGQGDAALIHTPQQKTVLIDAGPADADWSAAEWAIIPAMQHLNTARIHRLFISHPHLDHFGGVFRLLRYARVDTVYFPPLPVVAPPVDSLLQTLAAAGIPQRILRSGEVVSIDPETRVYVLGPFESHARYTVPSGKNVNNGSLVLLMKHRDQTLLFPGDAEAEAEAGLRSWGRVLRSDFLKVGHHGSETSSTPGLLSLVRPRFATISAGQWNRFGHPSPIVIRRLQTIRAEVFRTDRDRAIWLRIRNGEWERVFWE